MKRGGRTGDPLAALLALSGAIAVIAGAFAAHGATGKAADWITTGAHYQMIHAVAGLVALGKSRGPAALFLFGAALFAATLYAMALGGPRWLGAVTPLGGLAGWWLVDRLVGYLPYFLVVASSSFIYVALADLIPQLQRRLGARETLAQVAWLLGGIALVTVVSNFAHLH